MRWPTKKPPGGEKEMKYGGGVEEYELEKSAKLNLKDRIWRTRGGKIEGSDRK